ncbi:MAG: hypothetical protein IJU98_11145 [Synergistaceae bacterium]|nr:hypothetical protein [Synergistaceae bacterium]
MKKFAFALLLVLAAVSAASAAIPAQDFTLYNETGKTMVSLYVGPSGGRTWKAEDELGNYALASGAAVEVNFEPWDVARYWDIFVEFEDGTAWEYEHFDLFTISEITLHKGGVATSK